jgi:hypothetical protein
LIPLIFPLRCKTPQIFFQTIVDNFSLAIFLGVIGNAEMQLGSLYVEKFLPKIEGGSGVSVRDNRIRHAMKLEDIIHEDLSHYSSYEWVSKRKKMRIFGEMIYDHHDV